ncbi:MAG: LysR family transcriptional regulator [Pseudomonadota bacterium]
MAYPSIRNIPLEWIRAFESAARAGNFTAAAQEAGITQAAISQRIANLEARTGTALFVRQARGVTLSVEGEAWLPYVTSALEELEQSYQGLFGSERETITISASSSITQLWLIPKLLLWDEAIRPQLSFSTLILPTEKHHQEASVRFRYGIGDWADHYQIPLFNEAMSPVSILKLIKEENDWQDLPRLGVSGPRPGWQEWADETGGSATPVPGIRFDSHVSALDAALSGAGTMLASLPLCQHLLREQKLVRLSKSELHPRQTYWMIASKDAISKRQWDTLVDVFVDDVK